jgi:hypothetical protein
MNGALTETSGNPLVLAMVVKPGMRPEGGEKSEVVGSTGDKVVSDSKMERPWASWPGDVSEWW